MFLEQHNFFPIIADIGYPLPIDFPKIAISGFIKL